MWDLGFDGTLVTSITRYPIFAYTPTIALAVGSHRSQSQKVRPELEGSFIRHFSPKLLVRGYVLVKQRHVGIRDGGVRGEGLVVVSGRTMRIPAFRIQGCKGRP